MKISAMNQLKGKVTSIEEEGNSANSIVTIDIGGGNTVYSTTSNAAVAKLGLAVGKEAYAIITARNVLLGAD